MQDTAVLSNPNYHCHDSFLHVFVCPWVRAWQHSFRVIRLSLQSRIYEVFGLGASCLRHGSTAESFNGLFWLCLSWSFHEASVRDFLDSVSEQRS